MNQNHRSGIVLVATISLVGGLWFGGCAFPRGSTTGSTPVSVKLSGSSSVFLHSAAGIVGQKIAIPATECASRATDSAVTLLTTFDTSGNSVPVLFETSEGTTVVLIGTDVFPVGNNLGAVVTGEIETAHLYDAEGHVQTQNVVPLPKSPMTIFILASTRKVYDMTDYDLKNSISDSGSIYAVKSGTVYRLSFSNIGSAIPLNNGTITNITRLNSVVGSSLIANFATGGVALDGYAIEGFDSTYLLDTTGASPPRKIAEAIVHFPTPIVDMRVRYGNANYQIQDATGAVSGFDGAGCVFRLSCDSAGNTSVSDFAAVEGAETWGYAFPTNGSILRRSLSDSNRTIFHSGGVVEVTRNADSGITMNYYPTSLLAAVASSDSTRRFRVSDNEVLWADDTSIHYLRFNLSTRDFTTTTLYASSNFVSRPSSEEPLTLKGRTVFFYSYISASSVGMYCISLDDLNYVPIQCNQYDVPVSNVLEVIF